MISSKLILVECWEQKSGCNTVNKGWGVVTGMFSITPPSSVGDKWNMCSLQWSCAASTPPCLRQGAPLDSALLCVPLSSVCAHVCVRVHTCLRVCVRACAHASGNECIHSIPFPCLLHLLLCLVPLRNVNDWWRNFVSNVLNSSWETYYKNLRKNRDSLQIYDLKFWSNHLGF